MPPPRSFLLLLLPPLLAAPPPQCGLRSLRVGVSQLGLGYRSPESLELRYCGGGCPAPPTLHALALRAIGEGAAGIGEGAAGADLGDLGELGRGLGPCCRPTRFEDAAFLDERLRWQRLPGLSAGACACLG